MVQECETAESDFRALIEFRGNSAALHSIKTTTRRAGISALLQEAWSMALAWQERARSRHALSLMDEAALKDIGLSRSLAETEINKPFWRR